MFINKIQAQNILSDSDYYSYPVCHYLRLNHINRRRRRHTALIIHFEHISWRLSIEMLIKFSLFFIVLLAIVLCICTALGKFKYNFKVIFALVLIYFCFHEKKKSDYHLKVLMLRQLPKRSTQDVMRVMDPVIVELVAPNIFITKIAKNVYQSIWVTVVEIKICSTPKTNVKMHAFKMSNRIIY